MKDYRTRTKKKSNILHSWFFILALGFLLGIFIKSTYATFNKKSQATIEKERYEQQLQKLESKKDNLVNKIENLKTDRGKEEEYRKRFNVVKEGETMIRIIE